jgi:chromate transporter
VVAAGSNRDDWRLWLLTAISFVVVMRTRLNMLWLIGAGAVLGALGVVG